MKILIGVLLLASLSWSSSEKCVCYASGYAYSYKTKKYYYEDVHVSKRYTASRSNCGLSSNGTHAVNDWRRLFKSAVDKYYNYEISAITSCRSAKDSSKAKKSVRDRALDKKGDFRSENFSIRRIY